MLAAFRIYFISLLFLLTEVVSAQTSPVQVVRAAGQDGVHTYRIPGIIKTKSGVLIAVYDVRYNNSRDLPGDIDVGMSTSKDDGNSWEPIASLWTWALRMKIMAWETRPFSMTQSQIQPW
jgi:Neuraminidase (sialidase)